MNQWTWFLCSILLLTGCNDSEPASLPEPNLLATFTEDGAWCWFQDPRAVYFDGEHRRTYSGWMTKDAQLIVAQYDHKSGGIDKVVLEEEWDIDDHNTPSFLVRPDGHIMVFYARHNKLGLYTRRTIHPEDITSWEEEIMVSNEDRITYSHPVQLHAESNRMYVFYRGPSWKPTFTFSDDGVNWSEPQILIQQKGREAEDIRPYLKVVSDGDSTIHFAFTNGHPRNEPHNSVYYIKYAKGGFYKADGSLIGDMNKLPIDPLDSDLVYDAREHEVRAWIWDIALDSQGHPHVAYTRLPEESDHRYHYTRWDGATWNDHFITFAGGWFPQTQPGEEEREVHYSGGITFNQNSPHVVYFSHNEGAQFEISRAETADHGKTWEIDPITKRSNHLNVRPVFPHGYTGEADHVLWMSGEYIHYTDYRTAIRFITQNK